MARGRTDALLEEGEEGDDVVAGDLLDLVDALRVGGAESRRFAGALLGGLARDETRIGHRARRGQLDVQPGLVAMLRRPEPGHLGTAVAGNHLARGVAAGGTARKLPRRG